jgi:hypothetical protein
MPNNARGVNRDISENGTAWDQIRRERKVRKSTALEINDSQGNLSLTKSIDIEGNSFSVETVFEGSVSCTFTSATHCTGSYTIWGIVNSLSGTFTASRK